MRAILLYDIVGGVCWVWSMVLAGIHSRPDRAECGQANPLHYCRGDRRLAPARRIPRLEIARTEEQSVPAVPRLHRTGPENPPTQPERKRPETQNGEPGSSPFCSFDSRRRCRKASPGSHRKSGVVTSVKNQCPVESYFLRALATTIPLIRPRAGQCKRKNSSWADLRRDLCSGRAYFRKRASRT